jgi:prolyl 4-hydroxylase
MTDFIGQYYLNKVDLCDKIINFFESSEDLIYKGTVGPNEINTDYKDCDQCNLNDNISLFNEYLNELIVASNKYIKEYKFVDYYAPWGVIEPINIKRYVPPSQAFHSWHTERADSIMPVCLRNLVFMTYLNDIDDGGETEYYYQKLKIKPKKGLTVIWPADWTHTHRGITSPTQTKYIVTGWMSYLPKYD